jgi:hypothetical protein
MSDGITDMLIEQKKELIDFFTHLNDLDELGYTEKGIEFYVEQYLRLKK